MKGISIKSNPKFIGRNFELSKIRSISSANESAILIVYGRRRVGKTELLEQGFKDRNILKFEGIQGLNEKDQMQRCLHKLAAYTGNVLISKIFISCWLDFFELLAQEVQDGIWTVYLEELQWLANYNPQLISDLKHAWDNNLRHNQQLVLVLCGSSPSFMIDQVVHSKALYNRSQSEIHLQEFSILETKQFMPKRSNREIFDAYLTIGGIPEYLKWANKETSVFLSICKNAFLPNAFFVNEYDKIFTSSLSDNKHYKQIIEALSQTRFLSRAQILKKLGVSSSGNISELLCDLEKCGFIEKYHPYNVADKSKLVRYAITDNYLRFYLKFINPIRSNINNGDYIQNPQLAIKMDNYHKWLGFAFERWCRKNHMLIARILGFASVQYKSGTFFNRATNDDTPGYQIDLIFERADNVITVCEIKYLLGAVPSKVVAEFEKKLALFDNPKNKTIHRVLITASEPEAKLKDKYYFDHIITIDMMMKFADL